MVVVVAGALAGSLKSQISSAARFFADVDLAPDHRLGDA
jgi:hypothetical protein